MPIVFEPNQKIELHLPGGVFTGTIVKAVGVETGDWLVHIDDDENPVERTTRSVQR